MTRTSSVQAAQSVYTNQYPSFFCILPKAAAFPMQRLLSLDEAAIHWLAALQMRHELETGYRLFLAHQ